MPTTFTVRFGLEKMGVAPAGVDKPNSGHHHLLIDTDLPPLDKPIPNDETTCISALAKPKRPSPCRGAVILSNCCSETRSTFRTIRRCIQRSWWSMSGCRRRRRTVFDVVGAPIPTGGLEGRRTPSEMVG